jgi:hypothetical protein
VDQKSVIDNQQSGVKDEIVLAIVILPIVVIAYSVFSGTPDARDKLNLFFEYFNNLPDLVCLADCRYLRFNIWIETYCRYI